MPAKAKEIITPVEFEEAVDVQQLPEIDYDRRLTFGRLLTVTTTQLDLPHDYVGVVDRERARPDVLVGGLYVRRDDPRYSTANLMYGEVIFPSQEFPIVARSPRDLAKQMYAQNHKRNAALPDRDERHATAMRAAGHTLESKSVRLVGFQAFMIMRERTLTQLIGELDNTEHPWIAHFKAGNLEAARATADKAIHETAEVASVNLGWDNAAVQGLHRAIKFNLYHPDGNRDQQRFRWRAYLKMVLDHTKAKQQIGARSYQGCMKELETYQPYLDAQGKLF